MKRYQHIILLLPLLAILAGGCAAKHSDKPSVTVSIPPQKYLLQQIAGDKVDIVTLMDAGTNPETYQPSMSTMRGLESSMLYFTVGTLPFEQELVRRIADNGSSLTIVDTSHGIDLLHGTHGACAHHHHDDGQGHHHHDNGDPHIWSSVPNTRIMVRNMAEALIKADPDNADLYAANLKALDSRLDSLNVAVAHRLDSARAQSFVILHPSLSYFARDYGLQQIALGQEGKEATVQQQRERIDDARRHGSAILFVQQEFDTRQARTVADQIGATPITINPMNEDWWSEINNIVNALAPNE